MLTDYDFKSSYNRIDDDIAGDFYLPCMMSSVRYDRISGFFGSTVYVIAWKALKTFIANGGKMRIICSPVISDEDKAALETGNNAQTDKVLAKLLTREFTEMLQDQNLVASSKLLACLVATGILSIKIGVVIKNGHPTVQSMFHDKIGIFTDEQGNAVGFRGSFNETFKGLSNDGNIESADVFQSWDGGKEQQRVETSVDLFERIWNGKAAHSVQVYDLPQAINERIFEIADKTDFNALLDEIRISANSEERWKPDPKGRTPRKHQQEALDNWLAAGRRGILKHATGSGKTFTAICAIYDALKRNEPVLVLVPSKELLHQWKKDIAQSISGLDIHFLLCGDGNNAWKKGNLLATWTRAGIDSLRITIAIMATASTDAFIQQISAGKHLLIVADEVHNLGSPKRRNIFSIDAGARLGLSATPERYGDPEGTQALIDYFGGILAPEFSLEDAIKSHVLTKYFYHPSKVYLTPEEQEHWEQVSKELSRLIARLSSNGKLTDEIIKANPQLSQKMIERARILKEAENKVHLAVNIAKQHYQAGQKWIVYCDNQAQLNEVWHHLDSSGFDAYQYYADMTGDREATLQYFSQYGGFLVSIKCLDEGVDIPSTTHALILASSKNPREFIQRRGRVLRLSEGKAIAHVFDAITLPQGKIDDDDKNSSNIVLGELSRAIQFGTWAENPASITDLKLIALDYGIDYSAYLAGGLQDED